MAEIQTDGEEVKIVLKFTFSGADPFFQRVT